MKPKTSLLFTLATVLIVVGITWTKSSSQQNVNERGTIAWHVQNAKKSGKKQVEIPAPIPIYAAVNGLDDALARFTTVVAQLVEMKSYVQDRSKIVTWYKFRVLEYLSQPPQSECPDCLNDIVIPEELRPLQADEFVVSDVGGSVLVDGVEVSSRDSEFRQSFSLSQKYLLFLSLDSSRRVGSLNIGPSAIFTIDSDDVLAPVTKRPHPIGQDIEKTSRNSLSRVKEYVRQRLNK
ncbi:MAG TPA: hypothetical protein VJT82_12805 [Pyrinomonadaceae bacterium]|nr:hypothetical protein [Pyrinomonadaceae bacterium]